jgi:hypothetical protein
MPQPQPHDSRGKSDGWSKILRFPKSGNMAAGVARGGPTVADQRQAGHARRARGVEYDAMVGAVH